MILIEDKIISDDLLEEKFVCDLSACKGACCVEGDSGAPLEAGELEELEKIYHKVKPYLTDEGIEVIRNTGKSIRENDEFRTPLLSNGACAYIHYDQNNTAMCGIETASQQEEGLEFSKPLSCHLYPVRVKKYSEFQAVNYEKWEICHAACSLGQKLKIPVYQFVKTALIRKFGKDFYDMLSTIDRAKKKSLNKYNNQKNEKNNSPRCR